MTHHRYSEHHSPVSAKSDTGIGVPENTIAHNTRPACFFVSHSLAHSMAGCVGAEQSAPGSIVSGYANPAQSATSKIGVSGGGLIKTTMEIAFMAIDASARLKTYLFAAIDRANLKAKAPVMLRVSADCERSARVQLSGRYVLSFAGVIQNGGAL